MTLWISLMKSPTIYKCTVWRAGKCVARIASTNGHTSLHSNMSFLVDFVKIKLGLVVSLGRHCQTKWNAHIIVSMETHQNPDKTMKILYFNSAMVFSHLCWKWTSTFSFTILISFNNYPVTMQCCKCFNEMGSVTKKLHLPAVVRKKPNASPPKTRWYNISVTWWARDN